MVRKFLSLLVLAIAVIVLGFAAKLTGKQFSLGVTLGKIIPSASANDPACVGGSEGSCCD